MCEKLKLTSLNIQPAVSLTVRKSYSQFGGVLYIFYDTSPFDFPQLTFSVSCKTDTLCVGVGKNAKPCKLPPNSTFAQRNCKRNSQYFRADQLNGVACCQSEIGFNASTLLKLRRQFGNFIPPPHEL